MKRIHIIVTLILILLFTGCAKQTIMTWQEQYDLGIRYLNEGNYGEAIIAFTAAIEIDEKNVDAYLGRAEAYMNSNDANGITYALADYTVVIEIDTTCEAAYVGMANAYIKQGDYDKAKESLEKVTDESLKSELFTEIEKSIAETLVLSELQLENISYAFSADKEITELNEGSVGSMHISANALAPNNLKTVLIATWGENISDWSQNEIKEKVLQYANMQKDSGVSIDKNRELPYEISSYHPVYEENLGKHNEVLLVGLDENCNPVGYTIVKGEIPSQSELFNNIEVVEAASYTRAVVPPSWVDNPNYKPHSVSIPKISGNSSAIQEFNQKIMSQYKQNIDALKSGCLTNTHSSDPLLKEDQCLLYISYDYSICNGVVGILVDYTGASIGSSYWTNYNEYYFDTVEGKELSFIEYLNKLNIDFDKMTRLVNNNLRNNAVSEEYDQEPMLGNLRSEHRIKKALISEDGFKAIYESQVGMGGTVSISIDCPISDITSSEAISDSSTLDPVKLLTDFYNNNKEELSVYNTTYGEKYPNMVNAYLADLNNDHSPELCIKYIDSNNRRTHISIYIVDGGQVVSSPNCIDVQKSSMGYMDQDWRLLLDDGKLRACIIYKNTMFDDSIEYCVYNWGNNNASIVEDVAFRSRNGVYEFSDKVNDSGYPVYSEISLDEYTSKKAKYTKKFNEMILDTDNCGFSDIWNLQK